jgi:hypothetical protein
MARIPAATDDFLFFEASSRAHRTTQPCIQCYLRVFKAGIKRPNCGAEHSSPTSTKIRNKWSYTSTPTYAFLVRTRTSLPYHLSITLLHTPLSPNLSLSFIRSHQKPRHFSPRYNVKIVNTYGIKRGNIWKTKVMSLKQSAIK